MNGTSRKMRLKFGDISVMLLGHFSKAMSKRQMMKMPNMMRKRTHLPAVDLVCMVNLWGWEGKGKLGWFWIHCCSGGCQGEGLGATGGGVFANFGRNRVVIGVSFGYSMTMAQVRF